MGRPPHLILQPYSWTLSCAAGRDLGSRGSNELCSPRLKWGLGLKKLKGSGEPRSEEGGWVWSGLGLVLA